MNNKMNSWIATFTGEKFYPYNPDPSSINLEDIAQSLSMQCRFNGHCNTFYSVAQHSINCAKMAKDLGCSTKSQLHLLLHDASEAYLSDIPSPLKEYMDYYKEIEANVQSVIWQHFQLKQPTEEDEKIINHIDKEMLCWEGQHLTHNVDNWTERYKNKESNFIPPDDFFQERECKEVKSEFINVLYELLDKYFSETSKNQNKLNKN